MKLSKLLEIRASKLVHSALVLLFIGIASAVWTPSIFNESPSIGFLLGFVSIVFFQLAILSGIDGFMTLKKSSEADQEEWEREQTRKL